MEVAYRDQPPYLENNAIVGPTHSPVLDAMTSLEERERIEADYEWFRYSKFALPFLIFNLLAAVVLYCLSIWSGGTTLKHIRAGVPRIMETPRKGDDPEAGVPMSNRNLRTATYSIGLFGLIGIVATMHLKPAPALRKMLYFFFAFAGLFVAGVLAAISGAVDANDISNATWCRYLERGTVTIPYNCYSMQKLLAALVIVDLCCSVVCILTAIVLVIAASKSFQEPKEDEDEYEVSKRGVSRTTRECLLLLLFLVLTTLVIMFVFTILLSEGREIRFADDTHFVREYNNDKPGWPVKNTRLRVSATTIVIMMTLLNLIPFRSRVFAYVCAFVYFCASTLLMMSFALDVRALATARSMTCPFGFTCTYGIYICICIFDILLASLLLLYIIAEFVARLLHECRHCTRHFGFYEIAKHESNECSHRPVSCEVCSKKLDAKDFVYQHRFECGHDTCNCDQCGLLVPEWGMKKHQDECPQWPVKCSLCDVAFARSDLPAHIAACVMTPVSCEACGETFRSADMCDHLSKCSEVLVSCNVCNQRMPRYKIMTHKH